MTERFATGNAVLDFELPLLTVESLKKLADYARYLVWQQDEENDDWADTPLTQYEEAQIEESQRDLERGEYLTLEELIEGL